MNVSSAGWQVTLCDPMWRVSSRSGVATLQTTVHLLTYLFTYLLTYQCHLLVLFGSHVARTRLAKLLHRYGNSHAIYECHLPPGRGDSPAVIPAKL